MLFCIFAVLMQTDIKGTAILRIVILSEGPQGTESKDLN
jgi:hypothetical protein